MLTLQSMSISKSKVSILGCGWLGLPLGGQLAKQGFIVSGSTTTQDKLSIIESAGITPFLIDLKAELDDKNPFWNTDCLIINIPPSKFADGAYYKGMSEVLSVANAKHIIFVSSTSVYTDANREVVERDASEEAKSRSGISLLKTEKLFHGGDHTVIRMAGLIGAGRHPGKFLSGKQNLKGGKSPVNLIQLEDCIGVIEHILQQELWGEVFNACYPDHPTKKEYYELAAKALGVPPPHFSDAEAAWKIISSERIISSGYQFQKSIRNV